MSDCSAHGPNCGCPVAADAEAEHWASAQHAIWSHWMHWFFAHDTPENRERWKRQMDMPYAALSHREKQSDRDVVTQFLAPLIEPLKARAEAAEVELTAERERHRVTGLAGRSCVEMLTGTESDLRDADKALDEARRLLEELLDVLSRCRGPYEPLAAAPARYRTLTDAERAARAFLDREAGK